MRQVVGDHYRSTAETGGVLCLRCHHLELVGGGQAKLQSYERVASQDPASLHCGWEVPLLRHSPYLPNFLESFNCMSTNLVGHSVGHKGEIVLGNNMQVSSSQPKRVVPSPTRSNDLTAACFLNSQGDSIVMRDGWSWPSVMRLTEGLDAGAG